jgi:prevent-host-death family protein
MVTVSSYEAKTHLPQLLRRVEEGEEITITRHGQPIARIVPMQNRDRAALQAMIAEMREFRAHHKLNGLSIRQLIEEGRKY